MSQTKYEVKLTTQFKKDLKLCAKRNYKLSLLSEVVKMLQNELSLPEKYRDHELTGNYSGHRECHIRPDWLLIYKIENNNLILTLTRTGTHSDLF